MWNKKPKSLTSKPSISFFFTCFVSCILLLIAHTTWSAGLESEATFDVVIKDASKDDILRFLNKTCRARAEELGLRFSWQVNDGRVRDIPALTVDFEQQSLQQTVGILTRILGLQVRFGDEALSIADQSVLLDELKTCDFEVLTSFWEAVRINSKARRLTRPGEMSAAALEFFDLAAIPFRGTSVEVMDGGRILRVANSAESLAAMQELFKEMHCIPFEWSVAAMLVKYQSRGQVETGDEDEDDVVTVSESLDRQIRQGKISVIHRASFDLADMKPVKKKVGGAGGDVWGVLQLAPEAMGEDYDTALFALDWEWLSEGDSNPSKLSTGVALALDGVLFLQLPLRPGAADQTPYHLILRAEKQFKHQLDFGSRTAPEDKKHAEHSFSAAVRDKIVPEVRWDETPALAAVHWMREQCRELEVDGHPVTIDFVGQSSRTPERTTTMELGSLPLSEVIRYFCMANGFRYRMDGARISILSPTVPGETVVTRWFGTYDFNELDNSADSADAGAPEEGADARDAGIRSLFKSFGYLVDPSSYVRCLPCRSGHICVYSDTPSKARAVRRLFPASSAYDSLRQTRADFLLVPDASGLTEADREMMASGKKSGWKVWAENPAALHWQCTVLPGKPAMMEFPMLLGGKQQQLKLRLATRVEADACTVRLDTGIRLVDGQKSTKRVPDLQWQNTIRAFDGVLRPIRFSFRNGAGKVQTGMLLFRPTILSTYGTPVRFTLEEEAEIATAETIDDGDAEEVTRYLWSSVDDPSLLPVLRFFCRQSRPTHLKKEKHSASFTGLAEEVTPMLAARDEYAWKGGGQVVVRINGAGVPECAVDAVLMPGGAATVTLPVPGGARTVLRLQIEELLKRARYRFGLARSNVTDGRETETIEAWTGQPRSAGGAGKLTLTAFVVDGVGKPVGRPFAEAAALYNKRESERQRRLAAADALRGRAVPEFSVREATLEEALQQLRKVCAENGVEGWPANLQVLKPAPVPSSSGERGEVDEFGFDDFDEDGGVKAQSSDYETEYLPLMPPGALERTATVEVGNVSLHELITKIEQLYGCSSEVRESEGVFFVPRPAGFCARFSVKGDVFFSDPGELRNELQKRGVKIRRNDRVLYVPALDTLLAKGHKEFLAQLTRLFAEPRDPVVK